MNKLELLNRKASDSPMTEDETDELIDHMAKVMADHEVDYEKIEKLMYRGVPRADRKPKQPVRTEPKIGRNELCPCGSVKKYKKCCL